MTFLTLTPLQAALLALAVTGAILALHFLKFRRRRVIVSSCVLWRRVLAEKMSRSLWERLQKIVSILVAVTIALLIALSVGRPQIGALRGHVPRIVIVLDTSPSMNARTADGSTRWKHATEKARSLVTESPVAEFRIADTSGQTAFPFTSDRAEVLELIGRLSPSSVRPHFPKVSGDATVYLLSDGVGLDDVPAGVETVSVFERANNVAITAFEVKPVPSNPLAYEAYLEIRNYGQPAEVRLTIAGTSRENITRSVRLLSDARFREVFDLSNFAAGIVKASVQATTDALPMDDVAFAYLPAQRKIRTLLVTRGNEYLETLLRLDRSVELMTTNPQNYHEQPDIDAFVFDRFAPNTAPSKPALIVGVPGAAWLRSPQGVIQKPEFTAWSENHPIMQYVAVHEVSIERATRIDPQNLTVIAGSKETPLIVASEKPRWVMLTFDLGSSDFPLQSGFPIFMDNVLAWFSREELALRRSPGIVEIPLAHAQVESTGGKIIPSEQQLGKTVFAVNEPGLYTAIQGDTRLHIAVNLVNPDLSNINRSVLEARAPAAGRSDRFRRELWFYMLLFAIVLIGLEWFTYHRGITL
ncbi:MAG TPA: VWA domain-containing protein [Terriglobia bacterium]|nr:VWA domain-containing protein [Terriglobia bacterium]